LSRLPAFAPTRIIARSSADDQILNLRKLGYDDLFKLTGQTPTSMYNFVKLHAAEFTRDETAD
jgi:hypothetical protein